MCSFNPKGILNKHTSSLPFINLSLLLWTFLNLIYPSLIPLEKLTAFIEGPSSLSATIGTHLPFNSSTPSAKALAQVGMNKHCHSIWKQTRIISQLRASLCFFTRSVAFAIMILLVSPVERNLLLINYLVRLDHSTPRQFPFVLFSYRWQASKKGKTVRETEKKKTTKLSQSLFFPF